MTHKEYKKLFWGNYIDIESEMINCLKYVELIPNHFSVFSSKFARIILQCGSEVDNVFREICGISYGTRSTINDYYSIITSKIHGIIKYKATIKSTSIILQPFQSWSQSNPGSSLVWWESYNCIKHDRIANFNLATFENSLNILCALFILEMLRYDNIFSTDTDAYCNIPDESSKLFKLENHKMKIRDDCVINGMDYELEI